MSLSCIIISRALLVHRSLLRVVSVFSGLVWSPSIICLNVLCVILCRESQRTVLQSASWRGCEYSTWSDSCVFMFNISSTEPVGVRNTLFFSRWSIATSPCTTWHQLYVSPISLMPHEKGHVNLFSSMSLYQMGFCYFAEQ